MQILKKEITMLNYPYLIGSLWKIASARHVRISKNSEFLSKGDKLHRKLYACINGKIVIFFELETICLICTLNSKMDEKLIGQLLFILNL